jgi:hypothetical protein
MRLAAIRWIALALVGLVVAAGVSLAASQLVSERIGLAAEPVSAGKELAPAGQSQNGDPGEGNGAVHGGSASPTHTTTPPAVPSTTPPPATNPPATTAPSPPANGSAGEREPADD